MFNKSMIHFLNGRQHFQFGITTLPFILHTSIPVVRVTLHFQRYVENDGKEAEKHSKSHNRHQISVYLHTVKVVAPALPSIIHLEQNEQTRL